MKKNTKREHDMVLKKLKQYMKLHKWERFFAKEVKEDIAELTPPVKTEEAVYSFYMTKIGICAGLFLVCITCAAIIQYAERKQKVILQDETGTYIVRQNPDGVERKVPVSIVVDGTSEDGVIIVSEKKYSREEFEQKCDEIISSIPEQIKGDNKTLDHVTEDLNLELTGVFPITYEWSMDNYQYISSDGTVSFTKEAPPEQVVMLTLQLSYEDFYCEHSFPIVLAKDTTPFAQSDTQKAFDEIRQQEKENNTQQQFYLPTKLQDKSIQITEQKQPMALLVLTGGLLICILVFFAKNKDLHKEIEKRRDQLMREYPEFVSKLMLYMGAGMTTKGAFTLLTEEYRKKVKNKRGEERNYLYEELSYMMHAMENGVSWQDAFEQFGKRTKVNQYRKLMSILLQNNRKGTDNLLHILDEEAKDSFALRKTNAKRLGEKAGTKLLLPMTLMLGIVMIIIIVPAFLSYDI